MRPTVPSKGSFSPATPEGSIFSGRRETVTLAPFPTSPAVTHLSTRPELVRTVNGSTSMTTAGNRFVWPMNSATNRVIGRS